MSILNATHKKIWLIEDQGEAHSKSVCFQATVVYKFKCDLCDAGHQCWFYTPPSAPTCSRTQKIDFIDWQALSRQAFCSPKGSYGEFKCFKEVYKQI